MSLADRAFYGLAALAALAAAALGVATARLLLPLAADAGSTTQALTQWCLLFLTGSPETDELLLLALLIFLPLAALLGLGSLVRQWWATQQIVRARAAARLPRLPRQIARLSARLGLIDRLDIVAAPQPYSFCYGLLQPRVCLSTGLVRLLTEAELEAVLLHERYHVQSRDPLKVLLARMLSRAFFFLPVVDELGRHYATAKELAADRAVLAAQGHGRWLASALYKLITMPVVGEHGAAVATLPSAADARITHLLDPDAPIHLGFSPRALALSAVLLLAITAVVLSPGLVGVGPHVHASASATTSTCLLS